VGVCVGVCVCVCVYLLLFRITAGPIKFKASIVETFEVGSYYLVDEKLFEIFHGLSKHLSKQCSGNRIFLSDALGPNVVRIAGMMSVPGRGCFLFLQPCVQASLLFLKSPPFNLPKALRDNQVFFEDNHPNCFFLWQDLKILVPMTDAKDYLLDQVFVCLPKQHFSFSDLEDLGTGSLPKNLLKKHQPRLPLSFFFQSKVSFINQSIGFLSLLVMFSSKWDRSGMEE
jgi:hypothetical protein